MTDINDIKNLNNTADTTAEYEQSDINDNKVMAILAYFGILFLIPLFAAKNSKFARFHTNQGIVLCIAAIIASIVLSIITAILVFIPVLGVLLSGLLTTILSVICLILMIIGIINAAKGKAKELPIIGKFKILK